MNDTAQSRVLGTAFGLLLLAASTACSATDPAFLGRDGTPLDELPPVAYCIAIAPLDVSGVASPAPRTDDEDEVDELRFAYDLETVQARILAALQEQNAASNVVALESDELWEAQQAYADLLVRPRLRQAAQLRYAGFSDRFLLAGGLWLTTWFGALFVDDSTYEVPMVVEFEIVNPHDGMLLDSFLARSDEVDLSFLDRNELVSWHGLQTLFIPVFWTTDDDESTSVALSEAICQQLAARLTRYLKEDLAATESDYLGQVRLESPHNDETTGPIVNLRGKILANSAVTELTFYLNDSDEPVLELTRDQLPGAIEQRRGNHYQVFLDQRIDLPPGDNLLCIEMDIAGRLTSRTFRVRNPVVAESQP